MVVLGWWSHKKPAVDRHGCKFHQVAPIILSYGCANTLQKILSMNLAGLDGLSFVIWMSCVVESLSLYYHEDRHPFWHRGHHARSLGLHGRMRNGEKRSIAYPHKSSTIRPLSPEHNIRIIACHGKVKFMVI
jgi:hypothetical protein